MTKKDIIDEKLIVKETEELASVRDDDTSTGAHVYRILRFLAGVGLFCWMLYLMIEKDKEIFYPLWVVPAFLLGLVDEKLIGIILSAMANAYGSGKGK